MEWRGAGQMGFVFSKMWTNLFASEQEYKVRSRAATPATRAR